MGPAARLGAFAGVLAAVFGLAFGVGRAMEPADAGRQADPSVDAPGESDPADHGSGAHAGGDD